MYYCNRRCYFALVIIFLIGSAGCKTTSLTAGIDIHGMIYDFENRPVSGYVLMLNNDLRVVTDVTGRFTFEKVKIGTYSLTGQGGLYESCCETVDVYARGQIIYLRIPSLYQLLNLADSSLENHKIAEAETYLNRARTIEGENIDIDIYSSIVEFRKNNIERAISEIEKVKAKGFRADWIDSYHYELEKIQNTRQKQE